MDLILITPEKGQAKRIAQLLLSLADHPSHVATTGNPQGFVVPAGLFAKFEAAMAVEKAADETVSDSSDDVTATPKRRGRPRKQEQEQDTEEVQ